MSLEQSLKNLPEIKKDTIPNQEREIPKWLDYTLWGITYTLAAAAAASLIGPAIYDIYTKITN